jgi:putative peptide zinc metalloprotease protein
VILLSSQLDDETHVEFYKPFLRVKDGEKYIVGRADTRTFAEIPEAGVQAINLLEKGLSVKEVQDELKNVLGKEFDVKSFVSDLVSLGFVKSIGGQMVEEKRETKKALFKNVKKEHVGWLFSKPFLAGFVAPLIIVGITIMLLNPPYWPKPQDLLFYKWLAVSLLGGVGLSFALLFLHELAHLFAAKSLGVEGSMSISNRLYFVVVETNLSNLWTVPRKRRYLVYMAGLIFDLTTISVLVILMWLSDIHVLGGSGGILYQFAKAAVLLEFFRVVWQLMFYMRTDIYFLFADYLKCKNLYGDAVNYITNKLAKLSGKSDMQRDMSSIPESEMRVIRKYAIFFLVGTATSLIVFAILIVPLTTIIVVLAAQPLMKGYAGNEAAFTDSIVVISITAFEFILLLYSFLKNKRKH